MTSVLADRRQSPAPSLSLGSRSSPDILSSPGQEGITSMTNETNVLDLGTEHTNAAQLLIGSLTRCISISNRYDVDSMQRRLTNSMGGWVSSHKTTTAMVVHTFITLSSAESASCRMATVRVLSTGMVTHGIRISAIVCSEWGAKICFILIGKGGQVRGRRAGGVGGGGRERERV